MGRDFVEVADFLQEFAAIDGDDALGEFEVVESAAECGDGFGFSDWGGDIIEVDIALPEFAESSFGGAFGAPHRPDLVSAEAVGSEVVFGNSARSWDGEVVSEGEVGLPAFFADAAAENFEDEFFAFVSVESVEGIDSFEGGGFEGEEAVGFEAGCEDFDGAASVDEVAWQEVAGS